MASKSSMQTKSNDSRPSRSSSLSLTASDNGMYATAKDEELRSLQVA